MCQAIRQSGDQSGSHSCCQSLSQLTVSQVVNQAGSHSINQQSSQPGRVNQAGSHAVSQEVIYSSSHTGSQADKSGNHSFMQSGAQGVIHVVIQSVSHAVSQLSVEQANAGIHMCSWSAMQAFLQ